MLPFPDNRIYACRRGARGMRALVRSFLLKSKNLGRFLVQLFLREFLQVEGCAQVASPKHVSIGVSVDMVIKIDAEVRLCRGQGSARSKQACTKLNHDKGVARCDAGVGGGDEVLVWGATFRREGDLKHNLAKCAVSSTAEKPFFLRGAGPGTHSSSGPIFLPPNTLSPLYFSGSRLVLSRLPQFDSQSLDPSNSCEGPSAPAPTLPDGLRISNKNENMHT